MSMLDDLASYLTTQGLVGGATGWTIYKGYLPPTPDQGIALVETGGPEPDAEPVGSTASEYDEPTFQVYGRGAVFGYEALRTKMEAIFQALHKSQLGISATYVYVRAVQSGPVPLGLDDSDRPKLAWNFQAMRKRS